MLSPLPPTGWVMKSNRQPERSSFDPPPRPPSLQGGGSWAREIPNCCSCPKSLLSPPSLQGGGSGGWVERVKRTLQLWDIHPTGSARGQNLTTPVLNVNLVYTACWKSSAHSRAVPPIHPLLKLSNERIPPHRPRQLAGRYPYRTQRRGVRSARLRKGDDAARRTRRATEPARRVPRSRTATVSAAAAWPTRSSRVRNSAARLRSSAASATIATACTIRKSSRNSPSTSPTRRWSARPPAPASASSRRMPNAPCGRAWRCRATWRRGTSRRSGSPRANGCSSRGTSSPTRAPASTRSRKPSRAAKAAGTKIAITCSDAFVPQVFGDAFREALTQSDLLFCNATEAMAVAGGKTAEEAFGKLKGLVAERRGD